MAKKGMEAIGVDWQERTAGNGPDRRGDYWRGNAGEVRRDMDRNDPDGPG
jgi:hypothetical protein